jgi:hypothetical protein
MSFPTRTLRYRRSTSEYIEKEKPPLRKEGKVMGMDRGYRCMLACYSRMSKPISVESADDNASGNLELLGLAGVYSLRSLPSGGFE